MQAISQGGLFNPYLTRHVSENEKATDLTPLSMEDHLKNFRKSGLTQIEYCRVNRLSYSKLVYWLRKTKSGNQYANTGRK